jgi:hypothetical protein
MACRRDQRFFFLPLKRHSKVGEVVISAQQSLKVKGAHSEFVSSRSPMLAFKVDFARSAAWSGYSAVGAYASNA